MPTYTRNLRQLRYALRVVRDPKRLDDIIGLSQAIAPKLALLTFIVPASLLFHGNFSDKIQSVMFLKNMSIIGGILLVIGFSSDPMSLDKRLSASR